MSTNFAAIERSGSLTTIKQAGSKNPVSSSFYAFATTAMTGTLGAFSGSTFVISGSTITTTYRKRGYYPVGATFEYWTSTNPNSSAPSGHTLIDGTIIGLY